MIGEHIGRSSGTHGAYLITPCEVGISKHAQLTEGEGVGTKGTAAGAVPCARLDRFRQAFSEKKFGNVFAPYARARVGVARTLCLRQKINHV